MNKKLDVILNDQFLQILQGDNFDCQSYLADLIGKKSFSELMQTYSSYEKKEANLNNFLEDFALENEKFLKKQFSLPDKYGVSLKELF